MKIAIGRTGHEIADRVAESLAKGFGHYSDADVFIGYGILRGMAESFSKYEHFFNVDRGYFNPGHFDGAYRISYRGTQAKWHKGIPRKPIDIKLEPMRFHMDKPVLVCPPTYHVAEFFGLSGKIWPYPSNAVIRHKGDQSLINWSDYSAVYTFNSSVGWKALQMGIPVLSDPDHSLIGSFYNCRDLQSLTEKLQDMQDNRLELFEAMQAHQFTLAEIEQGKAWGLIQHYLSKSLSAMTIEKPSPPMSAPIASSAAPDQTLKSIYSNTAN